MRLYPFFKIFVIVLSIYFVLCILYYRSAKRETENTKEIEESDGRKFIAMKDIIPIEYELEKVQFLMEDDPDETLEFTRQEDLEAYSEVEAKSLDNSFPNTTASVQQNEVTIVDDVRKIELFRKEEVPQQKVESEQWKGSTGTEEMYPRQIKTEREKSPPFTRQIILETKINRSVPALVMGP